MLVDVYLIESYNGVSAGQHTQVEPEIAESLIASGKAEPLQNKVEQKKSK